MPLGPGARLGPYLIGAPLGAGGMGEVYRATDTKLKREVAIKVLPASVASDADRLARFQREAEVLAALNHPNIAHIHGLEEADGTNALVMELVEGPTLADRIAQGAIPIDEALPIARQIAEALEAAHEQGIIHRDLKPANVKVRPDGTVKVLDFGLAKALDQGSGIRDQGSTHLANSPTVASPAMTAAGIILGTAAYMSPEQARGQVVDARTDLWAFGCVLFEMLTSRRPFAGDTVTDLLAAVVKEEPRWDALPADTPAATRKLLRRCLTKDRKRRLASAADARLEVEESLDPALAALAPGPAPAARRSPLFMILGVGVVLAVGTGAYLLGRGATPAPAASAARFIIPAPPGTQIVSGHREVAISADGQQIAFIARGATEQHIYVRRVDDLTPRLIAGTEAARDLTFSPDGRSLAFHSGDTIRKVSLAGGAPTRLADARHTHGLAWRPGEDAIYFAPNNDPGVAIWKVPASGESPAVAVTTLDAAGGEVRHTWPVLSIDGDTLIFTVGDAQGNPAVSTLSLATGARRTMRTDGGAFALTDRSEFLFVRGQLVMRALDGNGPPSAPELLATSAAIRSDNSTGTVALSATGTLAYVPSPDIQRRSLVWIVPDGRLSDAGFGARELRGVSLSQDGRRVAMSVGQGQESVLYRADAAGGPLTPLAKPGPAVTSWSPDGRWIAGAMRLADARTSTVARVAVESGGNWEPLLSSENIRGMALWTPDGQGLLLPGMEAGRNQTLLLRLDRTPPEASIVVARPGNVQFASLSPDGRWVAYESDEFGRPEVYVQSYPDPTIRVQVSGGRVTAPNGSWPTWSKAGDALYLQIGGTILRSSVTTDPRLRVGEPRLIVSDPLIVPGSTAEKTFDVAPDGRILAIREDDSVRSDHIVVEQNWLSGVRAPSPEGRE